MLQSYQLLCRSWLMPWHCVPQAQETILLKLSSTIRTNMYSYKETGSQSSCVSSIPSESLSCKSSSNFKVHIIIKDFGLPNFFKTSICINLVLSIFDWRNMLRNVKIYGVIYPLQDLCGYSLVNNNLLFFHMEDLNLERDKRKMI